MIKIFKETLTQELENNKDYNKHFKSIKEIVNRVSVVVDNILHLKPENIQWRLTEQMSIDITIELPNGERMFVEYYVPIRNIRVYTKEEVVINYTPEINRKKIHWNGSVEESLKIIDKIKL